MTESFLLQEKTPLREQYENYKSIVKSLISAPLDWTFPKKDLDHLPH